MNKLPSKGNVRLLIAEDVRQEIAGKFTLIGLVPGERFEVGGTPPPGSNVAVVLPSLAFLFIITGGEGKFDGSFSITGPNKKVMKAVTPFTQPLELRKTNATLWGTTARPFIAPIFGTYTIGLKIGGTTYKFPMVIDQAAPPRQPAAKP